MALQNRVDPFGQIHAVAARGMFTGNRGVIHDPATRTLLRRRWTTRAWLICACDFKGLKRAVMGRNSRNGGAGWTELFFLDEVTALAAGHRPCFFCRRERAEAFAQALTSEFGRRPTAPDIDARLHRERLASGGSPTPIDASDISALPSGTMVADESGPYAIDQANALPWRFKGYGPAEPIPAVRWKSPVVLTPPTTLSALRNGYRPAWHASASS